MASGDAIATPGNQVIELAGVLSKLLPSFFGKTTTEAGTGASNGSSTETGATSSTSKKSIDPKTQEQLDSLLGTSMTNATSTTQTDKIVEGIFRKAAEAFAPTLGEQNKAGVHNSSVNALLRNDAIARATEDASTAVLGAQQKAADTAAGLLKTSAEGNAAIKADGTNNAAKTAASTTSENKTSAAKPTLMGGDPVTAIMMAALTAYAGGKIKKFASPYLDSVFGSDGGSAVGTGANALSGDSIAGSIGAESTGVYTSSGADTVVDGTPMYLNSEGADIAAGSVSTTVEDAALSGATDAVTGASTTTLGADGAAGLVGTGAGGVNQYAQYASIDNSAPIISEADSASQIAALAGGGGEAAGTGVAAASGDSIAASVGAAGEGAAAAGLGSLAMGAGAVFGGTLLVGSIIDKLTGGSGYTEEDERNYRQYLSNRGITEQQYQNELSATAMELAQNSNAG